MNPKVLMVYGSFWPVGSREPAGSCSSAAVVRSRRRAHTGKPGLPGFLAAGQFPREIAVEPDGLKLLVTNCISGQLETVSLPG